MFSSCSAALLRINKIFVSLFWKVFDEGSQTLSFCSLSIQSGRLLPSDFHQHAVFDQSLCHVIPTHLDFHLLCISTPFKFAIFFKLTAVVISTVVVRPVVISRDRKNRDHWDRRSQVHFRTDNVLTGTFCNAFAKLVIWYKIFILFYNS